MYALKFTEKNNKGKYVLVLNEAPPHDVQGSEGIVKRILNLGTRWR
jgi:hypothetical protein